MARAAPVALVTAVGGRGRIGFHQQFAEAEGVQLLRYDDRRTPSPTFDGMIAQELRERLTDALNSRDVIP